MFRTARNQRDVALCEPQRCSSEALPNSSERNGDAIRKRDLNVKVRQETGFNRFKQNDGETARIVHLSTSAAVEVAGYIWSSSTAFDCAAVVSNTRAFLQN